MTEIGLRRRTLEERVDHLIAEFALLRVQVDKLLKAYVEVDRPDAPLPMWAQFRCPECGNSTERWVTAIPFEDTPVCLNHSAMVLIGWRRTWDHGDE